jgi:hypothetical protein
LAGRRRVEDRFDIVESVHRMESVYVEELGRTAPRSFAGRKAADG